MSHFSVSYYSKYIILIMFYGLNLIVTANCTSTINVNGFKLNFSWLSWDFKIIFCPHYKIIAMLGESYSR